MRILDLERTEELFKKYGIKTTKSVFVSGTSGAARLKLLESAVKLGFPLILKVISKDIPSKKEAGAVSEPLYAPADAEKAYDALLKTVRRKKPHAKLQGVLVQKYVMSPAVSVTLRHDAQFGAVVLVRASPLISSPPSSVPDAVGFAPLDKKHAEQLAATLALDKAFVPGLTDCLIKLSRCGAEKKLDLLCEPVFLTSVGAEVADAKVSER